MSRQFHRIPTDRISNQLTYSCNPTRQTSAAQVQHISQETANWLKYISLLVLETQDETWGIPTFDEPLRWGPPYKNSNRHLKISWGSSIWGGQTWAFLEPLKSTEGRAPATLMVTVSSAEGKVRRWGGLTGTAYHPLQHQKYLRNPALPEKLLREDAKRGLMHRSCHLAKID